MSIDLPRLPRGRPTAAGKAAYAAELQEFCALIRKIRSTLDFPISSRGWCYILEEHGLRKGDFNQAQELIAECRRQRLLPMDIVAEDGARSFDNLEDLDDDDPDEQARHIVDSIAWRHHFYTPVSFWEAQGVYLEMLVEKIDLKSLFAHICNRFCIPIANARGWSDLRSRWAMLQRIRYWAHRGKRCVVLYCGDHDPVGLQISTILRQNFAELLTHGEWLTLMPMLEIDRFGLNADFIETQDLTWIDNLETGSGKDLASPRHPDHRKPHVQNYMRRFGARKVEANALVVRPDAGRDLCLRAVLNYLPEDAPAEYRETLRPHRDELQKAILTRLQETYSTNPPAP